MLKKPSTKASASAAKYILQLEVQRDRLQLTNDKLSTENEKLRGRLEAEPNPASLEVALGLDEGKLRIIVPPAPGATAPHSLHIGLEGAGFVLQRILRAQQAATEASLFRVGHMANPTQSMVESWLKAGGRVKQFSEAGRAIFDLNGVEL